MIVWELIPTESDYNNHILSCLGDSPIQCPHCHICFYASYRISSLRAHIDTFHSECYLKCDNCSFKTRYPDVLQKHVDNSCDKGVPDKSSDHTPSVFDFY